MAGKFISVYTFEYRKYNTVTFGSPLIAAGEREDGGYGIDVLAAHLDSYLRSDLWGDYDVTGTKGGSATITLDLGTQQYYHAPNIV